MDNTSIGLDKWRDYFRTVNSDIFSIIEHAIIVAASDCPYDFKLKRDRIAQTLFNCKITKCFGCDRIELSVPKIDGVEKSDNDKYKSGIIEAGGSKDTKESKVNSSRDDYNDYNREIIEMNASNKYNYHVRDDCYGDAEALTDEIEKESEFYEEVLRIRDIIDNSEEESDEVLFDSLRRLQLMCLSVEILKTTEIGKSVNALRKHGSKEIRNLVRTLVNNWKIMVDEWVNATTAIAGTEITTESVKTSVVEEEEEGLPSPPLDEGAFFATPASMELSQFFDGMDDDGNPQNCKEFNENRGNSRKRRPEKPDIVIPKRNLEIRDQSNTFLNDDSKGENKSNQEPMLRKQAPPCKPNRPVKDESGTTRPKLASQIKAKNEIMVQQKSDKGTIQKKPVPHQRENLNGNDEALVRTKLEAAKRKL
ncbi:hypothetical protein CASFOL_014634 [Castilleja foliolosa]|uniref:TFIIS N-terminal domain-containing protein n=1 Tax=Castilleja foliolosa TaxID=1961234 RepID=A0ABD3DBG0_9LAMI